MQPQIQARAFTVTARLFRLALAASLTVSALLFFLWSWRWPLVGDASLIHYIGFLIERGWAPYRDLSDMNMPGSYLIELAAMHFFGMGALAWRLFDFTLLAIASTSYCVIATNSGAPSFPALSERVGSIERWLPALFASSLFILIHGRDGLAQGGQRDLTMAVCLVAATAFLFVAVRRRAPSHAAIFGLLSGIAVTIKPTAILLTLAELLLAIYALRGSSMNTRPDRDIATPRSPKGKAPNISPFQLTASAAAAYLIAPMITLAFLLREHAFTAFLATTRGVIPYYASLGHRPLSYILLHSLSPLLSLVLLWLPMLALDRTQLHEDRNHPRDWERTALLAGVTFGILNCILQARALPYYRYPLLAFLLPLMALDFTRALKLRPSASPGAPSFAASSRRVGSADLNRSGAPSFAASSRRVGSNAARVLAIAALIVGGFFLAPQSAILIHRYRWWETDFITSLEQNLNALGGAQLSGHIQCIDSVSGCGNVLYLMRLEPATGVLSDFLLFGPDDVPIIRDTRSQFSAGLLHDPPHVIIVTSHLHLADLEIYQKLDRWPAFASFLADRYTLQTQWSPTRTARWWSREELPASYRIYVLRPTAGGPMTAKP